MAALERAWRAIRDKHRELPAAVLVTGAGSDPRRSQLVHLGHFAADRWTATDRRSALPEVFVGGEGLAREAEEVFETLLHEAAHALARTRGIKDTSRQGRYHNRRFREVAEALGLTVERHRVRGFATTALSDRARHCYRHAIDALDGALSAYRELEPAARAPGRARNRLSCSCSCGRRIWASPSTLAGGAITCAACGAPFAPVA